MAISLFSVNVCLIAAVLFSAIPFIHALGSGAILVVIDDDSSGTVCGIVAGQTTQRIECYRRGQIVPVTPNISFSSISGGRSYSATVGPVTSVCSARTPVSSNSNEFQEKRLYSSFTVLLENLAVGDTQVCATIVGSGSLCWRPNDRPTQNAFHMYTQQFQSK